MLQHIIYDDDVVNIKEQVDANQKSFDKKVVNVDALRDP